jgi:hypothetical protein
MKKRRSRACGKCEFFHEEDQTCHRFPPEVVARPTPDPLAELEIVKVWRPVSPEEECGEFELATDFEDSKGGR